MVYVFLFFIKKPKKLLFCAKRKSISSEVTHLSSYLSKSIEIPKITVSEIGKDLICNNNAYWGLVLKRKI